MEAAPWAGCPAKFLRAGAQAGWDGSHGYASVKAAWSECPGGVSGGGARPEPTGASASRPLVGDATELLRRMQSDNGLTSFAELRKWSWDGLTFRESWTDEDTEFLRRLDGRPGAWVDGKLTTEAVRDVLPTFAEFQTLVDRQRLAIVGSGPSASWKGDEIDLHPVVARFNEFDQYKALMGNRIDIHALNGVIVAPSEPKVWQVQLEIMKYFEPFCSQLHRQGRFYDPSQLQHLLFIRPSVKCSVPGLGGWSRGFLFYWLMGSMFSSVDLYGMSGSDGRRHTNGKGRVTEPFLEFEHQIYRQIYEGHKASGAGLAASFLNASRGPPALPPPPPLRFVPEPGWLLGASGPPAPAPQS